MKTVIKHLAPAGIIGFLAFIIQLFPSLFIAAVFLVDDELIIDDLIKGVIYFMWRALLIALAPAVIAVPFEKLANKNRKLIFLTPLLLFGILAISLTIAVLFEKFNRAFSISLLDISIFVILPYSILFCIYWVLLWTETIIYQTAKKLISRIVAR